MNVRELIAKLQEFDPELPVTAYHPRYGWSEDYAERAVYDAVSEYEAKLPDDGDFDVKTEKQVGPHIRIG